MGWANFNKTINEQSAGRRRSFDIFTCLVNIVFLIKQYFYQTDCYHLIEVLRQRKQCKTYYGHSSEWSELIFKDFEQRRRMLKAKEEYKNVHTSQARTDKQICSTANIGQKKILKCLIIMLLLTYTAALHSTNDTNSSIVYTHNPLNTPKCNPTNVNMKQSCQTNEDYLKLFISNCGFNALCNSGYEPICVDIDEGKVYICAPIGLTCAKGYQWRTWIDTIDHSVKINVEKCPQGTFQPHESDCFHACEFKHLDVKEIPEKYLLYSVGDNIFPTYVYCNYKKHNYNNEGNFLLDYDQDSKYNHYFCTNVDAHNPCLDGLSPLPNGTCVLPCSPEECRDDFDDFICKSGCREQSSDEHDADTTVNRDLENECQTDFGFCKNGECKQSYGSYVCQCLPGFRNDIDTGGCIDIEECLEIEDTCINGNCTNSLGGYNCTCNPGYKLDKDTRQCTDIDECQENNGLCIHGKCTNELGGYTCLCDTGYELDNGTRQCKDINECRKEEGLCINGHCINTFGGYTCLCETGFQMGNDTGKCIDIDECVDNEELCINGSCINTDGGYSCLCADGYKLAKGAQQCDDIDECKEIDRICVNGNCANTFGAYFCICSTGFIMDNYTQHCIDIDECLEDNYLCINGYCKNTFGGYSCLCETGFKVDKDTQKCIDINECLELDGLCPNGYCINVIRGYNCLCDTGFKFDNLTEQCIDVDECQDINRLCVHGNCINRIGGFTCLCNNGFELEVDAESLQCIDIDECRSKEEVCEHGNCTNSLGGYTCLCDVGYKQSKKSRACIDIDECHENEEMCKHGNCTNVHGGYTCLCDAGYILDNNTKQCIDIGSTETSLTPIEVPIVIFVAVLFVIILIIIFYKRRASRGCFTINRHGTSSKSPSTFENKEFKIGIDDEDNGGEPNHLNSKASVKEPLIKKRGDNESFSSNSVLNGETRDYTQKTGGEEIEKLDDHNRRGKGKTNRGTSTCKEKINRDVILKTANGNKGGEFKKEIDDTNTQAVVSNLDNCMKSCGALIYKNNVAGTVFRVGDVYIMTAFHVIRDIILDPTGKTLYDYSRLENSDDVTLNFNESICQPSRRRFRLKLRFDDEAFDVAIIEIMDIANVEDIPKGLLLWKYDISRKYLKKISVIGYGHPKNQIEKHSETCNIVLDLQERLRKAHVRLSRQGKKYKSDLRGKGHNPLSVEAGYDGLDDPTLIVFDSFMEKGLSGAPILTYEGNSTKVIGIVLGGKPDFYYQLSAKTQAMFETKHLFEYGRKMEMIHTKIRLKDRTLADQLFCGI